jgi:hypothetical protein
MKRINKVIIRSSKRRPDDNQCIKLLRYLRELKNLGTLQIRGLGIMHPADCVYRLRREGRNILTKKKKAFDIYGRPHFVACYVLLPGKYNGRRKI